jgi:hypothetical protein
MGDIEFDKETDGKVEVRAKFKSIKDLLRNIVTGIAFIASLGGATYSHFSVSDIQAKLKDADARYQQLSDKYEALRIELEACKARSEAQSVLLQGGIPIRGQTAPQGH